MHTVKTIPAGIVAALGLFILAGVAACGKTEPAAPPAVAEAQAAASSAEASASSAEASAAQTRAEAPAAGAVANNAGINQTGGKPTASVQEQAQAGSVESSPELRDKVAAARAAGQAAGQAAKP